MSTPLRLFLSRHCSLASLAYAARMKRLGHRYFTIAIAALYSSSDDPQPIYDGERMPSTIRPNPLLGATLLS
jgi:hypothetical protein